MHKISWQSFQQLFTYFSLDQRVGHTRLTDRHCKLLAWKKLDYYHFKTFGQKCFYLRLVDGGDPHGAALWGAGCKYVDVHSTLKLTYFHKNKWIWEKRRNNYGIYNIFTQNPTVLYLGHKKLLLTAIFQCYAVRSVEGQWRSNYLQPLSFLLDFGH